MARKMKTRKITIPVRRICAWGTDRHPDASVLKLRTLDELLDTMKRIEAKSSFRDVRARLRDTKVSFPNGQMVVHVPHERTGFRAMSLGASHLHADVLASGGWNTLKLLSRLNPERASGMWEDFAQTCGAKMYRRLRTQRLSWCSSCKSAYQPSCGAAGHRREVHLGLRAVVSDTYADYRNVHLIEDILNHSGHFAKMPVLNWSLSDSGMVVRFLGLTKGAALMGRLRPQTLLDTPQPVIEVRNSECKAASLTVTGGLWNMKTASGFGHWDANTGRSWSHRGNPRKIRDGFEDAFTAMSKTAQEVVDAYEDAKTLELEDPAEWLREKLGTKDGNKAIAEAAVEALKDPDVTPGKKLASVIDALTLVASQKADIYAARDVERAASRLLRIGVGL
jgi:hypothetical protein